MKNSIDADLPPHWLGSILGEFVSFVALTIFLASIAVWALVLAQRA